MTDMLDKLYAANGRWCGPPTKRASRSTSCGSARRRPRTRERRPFRAALSAGEGPAIIAEIKRASPSVGLIVRELDPAAIARAYEAAGANAISVLTESRPFSRRSRLRRHRAQRVPACRSCARTFMRTRYEVAQSAAYGADCVLAIVAGLDDEELTRDVRRGARATRSTCWSKCTTRRELARAVAARGDAARDQQPRSADVRNEPGRDGGVAAARPVLDRRRSPRAACARATTCSRSTRPGRAGSSSANR